MPDYSTNFNIPKALGTENANRAYFIDVIDTIDANASQAQNIRIADAEGKFTAGNVEGALSELFQYAGNGKTDMASVIGAPAVSADTFAQLKTKAQDAKNTLAANLTAKGQSAAGTESLAALADKVANVNTGKKFASGTVISPNTLNQFAYAVTGTNLANMFFVEVSGLGFKPSLILIEGIANSGGNFPTTMYSEQNVTSYPKVAKVANFTTTSTNTHTNSNFKGDAASAYVNATGFKLPVLFGNITYNWAAYE